MAWFRWDLAIQYMLRAEVNSKVTPRRKVILKPKDFEVNHLMIFSLATLE